MAANTMNAVPTRDDRYRRAFSLIYEFTTQLAATFEPPKKDNPLALYKRLIDKVQINDSPIMGRFVHGFKAFYDVYAEDVVHDTLDRMKPGTMIRYQNDGHVGDRIFIPIEVLYRKSDVGTRSVIRQHLLGIGNYLVADGQKNDMAAALKEAMASNPNPHGDPNELNEKEQEFVKIFSARVEKIMEGHDPNTGTIDDLLQRAIDCKFFGEILAWITANGTSISIPRIFNYMMEFMKQKMPGMLTS